MKKKKQNKRYGLNIIFVLFVSAMVCVGIIQYITLEQRTQEQDFSLREYEDCIFTYFNCEETKQLSCEEKLEMCLNVYKILEKPAEEWICDELAEKNVTSGEWIDACCRIDAWLATCLAIDDFDLNEVRTWNEPYYICYGKNIPEDCHNITKEWILDCASAGEKYIIEKTDICVRGHCNTSTGKCEDVPAGFTGKWKCHERAICCGEQTNTTTGEIHENICDGCCLDPYYEYCKEGYC